MDNKIKEKINQDDRSANKINKFKQSAAINDLKN